MCELVHVLETEPELAVAEHVAESVLVGLPILIEIHAAIETTLQNSPSLNTWK